jgi:hypothetical protein
MSERDQSTDLVRSEQLQKALLENPEFKEVFCRCWPCAGSVIDAILKNKPFPIPPPVEAFLRSLVTAGDLAHDKLCK